MNAIDDRSAQIGQWERRFWILVAITIGCSLLASCSTGSPDSADRKSGLSGLFSSRDSGSANRKRSQGDLAGPIGSGIQIFLQAAVIESKLDDFYRQHDRWPSNEMEFAGYWRPSGFAGAEFPITGISFTPMENDKLKVVLDVPLTLKLNKPLP